jgi:flavin reductase (DIM6/NTAB) family NADH-FMN oxidoreductase RutF
MSTISLAPTFDARAFRATMGRFASGVTVVSTYADSEIRGMTANAFVSVSLDPPLVLVSIGHQARMHALLAPGVAFGVSVLGEEQMALSDRFAGRPVAGPAPVWEQLADTPLLAGALAQIAARVVATHPAGDHTLVVGQVAALVQRPGRPLLFYGGAYHQLGAS